MFSPSSHRRVPEVYLSRHSPLNQQITRKAQVKQVLVFILVHVTGSAETKAEGEGGICQGDGRGVGCCSWGLVEGFQTVNNTWDCNLEG